MALLVNINIQTEHSLIARPNCALGGKENLLLHKKFLGGKENLLLHKKFLSTK